MKRFANTKNSYVVMKLDYMLDQYKDYETIDLEEMHTFVALYNQLPIHKKMQYSHLLDEAVDLWDEAEQPEY